jgi:hypothetical protein
MLKFKIQWSFVNQKQACKVIDVLGAKSLDCVNFYTKNKKVDTYSNMICFAREMADK